MNSCAHGALFNRRTVEAMREVRTDLDILIMNTTKNKPFSNKAKKKVNSRMKKVFTRVSTAKDPEEGKKIVLAEMYGHATCDLLEGEYGMANYYLYRAYMIKTMSVDDSPEPPLRNRGDLLSLGINPKDYYNDLERQLMGNVQGMGYEQGNVLYVAKQIPCKCLNEMKKKVKQGGRIGVCLVCTKHSPTKEQFQCSGCGVSVYCSKKCQLTDWIDHQKVCSQWEADQQARRRQILNVNAIIKDFINARNNNNLVVPHITKSLAFMSQNTTTTSRRRDAPLDWPTQTTMTTIVPPPLCDLVKPTPSMYTRKDYPGIERHMPACMRGDNFLPHLHEVVVRLHSDKALWDRWGSAGFSFPFEHIRLMFWSVVSQCMEASHDAYLSKPINWEWCHWAYIRFSIGAVFTDPSTGAMRLGGT